jgi:hypothetical protein
VRHGDKRLEANMLPFHYYVQQVSTQLRLHWQHQSTGDSQPVKEIKGTKTNSSSHQLPRSRCLYVATDDEALISGLKLNASHLVLSTVCVVVFVCLFVGLLVCWFVCLLVCVGLCWFVLERLERLVSLVSLASECVSGCIGEWVREWASACSYQHTPAGPRLPYLRFVVIREPRR